MNYFDENIIKECDKLPNKIKISLEKGKEIENNWDNNKIPLLINNCINIENNIRNIKLINGNIGKINSSKIDIKFYPKEEGINNLLDSIKIFGRINAKNLFDSKIEFIEDLVKSWLIIRNLKQNYYIENQEMVQHQMIFIINVIIKE